MIMARIKRDLKRKSVIEKTSQSSAIAKACEENESLGDISGQLSVFVAATGAMERAALESAKAHAEAKHSTTMLVEAEKAWDSAFESLCSAIEAATGGNAQKILSASVKVYERGRKPLLGKPAAPQNLAAKIGTYDGTVNLTWEKVYGRLVFVVQFNTDAAGESGWITAGMPTACKFTVKGLESGKKYWFRVAAIGTAGQSPWSDPALCMAA